MVLLAGHSQLAGLDDSVLNRYLYVMAMKTAKMALMNLPTHVMALVSKATDNHGEI